MFEKLIREIGKASQRTQIKVSVPLDELGFYDRRCPNSECAQSFKVLFVDWRDKVSDAQSFCPFCRHESNSDQWNTPEQTRHLRSAALAQAARQMQGAVKRGMEPGLSYTLSPIPSVVPAQATAVRQEFACEKCECRYASLGASFFCPACGHNSAESCFDNTIETVRGTVRNLPSVHKMLEESAGPDAARDEVRQTLEGQLVRLVGAFERLNEAMFDKLPNASQFPKKRNRFQRLDDGAELWRKATGKTYSDFLTTAELRRMKIMFQRRHAFSHCAGIVDQNYIERSGDTRYLIGQRLVARECDVLEFAGLLATLAAGTRTLNPPPDSPVATDPSPPA